MKPMFALHKDRQGAVLTAGSFAYDYEFSTFLRGLDIRPGDTIEFGEAVQRAEEAEPTAAEDEPFTPAFLAETPMPVPAAAADDQPF
jgi:hypothetical protein